MTFLDELNSKQRQAAEADSGPLVIIAGPGTGKTKTLTARIAHLVLSGRAAPEDILALTFTNKAAKEMQERVALLLSGKKPTVTTFHGLAYALVNDEMSTLVSESDRVAILAAIKKTQQRKDQSVRDLSWLLSQLKSRTELPADPSHTALLEAYNLELSARNLYDFDDLLLRFHAILREGSLSPVYRYILVDEFQDTNDLQYALLKLLDTTGNIFVIGDPLQSIYGFRGANAAVFDRLQQDWPGTTRIVLTTNYRSTPEIVQTSNAIFPAQPVLEPFRQQSGTVCAVEVLNEYGEADWIVNEIERSVGGSDMLRGSEHHQSDEGRTFQDFAVIYRTHAVARAVQQALERSGIPYQVAGEGSPFLQPHIACIIQSLGYIAELTEAPPVKNLSPRQTSKLLDPLKNALPELKLPQVVQRIVELFELQSDRSVTALRQFTNSLIPYEAWDIGAYVQHIQTLAEQEYYDPAASAVTLLTIHAAKGLEFPCVFVIGTEQGIIPYARNGTVDNLEEERRLFYVAVTRAKDKLYLLHARKRGGKEQAVSEFIAGLPSVRRMVDPAIAGQLRKIQRREQKRAQSSLF